MATRRCDVHRTTLARWRTRRQTFGGATLVRVRGWCLIAVMEWTGEGTASAFGRSVASSPPAEPARLHGDVVRFQDDAHRRTAYHVDWAEAMTGKPAADDQRMVCVEHGKADHVIEGVRGKLQSPLPPAPARVSCCFWSGWDTRRAPDNPHAPFRAL